MICHDRCVASPACPGWWDTEVLVGGRPKAAPTVGVVQGTICSVFSGKEGGCNSKQWIQESN